MHWSRLSTPPFPRGARFPTQGAAPLALAEFSERSPATTRSSSGFDPLGLLSKMTCSIVRPEASKTIIIARRAFARCLLAARYVSCGSAGGWAARSAARVIRTDVECPGAVLNQPHDRVSAPVELALTCEVPRDMRPISRCHRASCSRIVAAVLSTPRPPAPAQVSRASYRAVLPRRFRHRAGDCGRSGAWHPVSLIGGEEAVHYRKRRLTMIAILIEAAMHYITAGGWRLLNACEGAMVTLFLKDALDRSAGVVRRWRNSRRSGDDF